MRSAVSLAWVCSFWLVGMLGLAAERAAAQEPARGVEARALFDQGVQLARQEAWSDAAVLFERSLELVARPATALNLMLVYDSLKRPLDVVRMVRRLLEITDPVRHESERQQALRLESQAFAMLAQVMLSVTPGEALVQIDGASPVFAATGQLLLDAGVHTLEFAAPGHAPQSRTVRAQAGARSELHITLARVADDAIAPSLVPKVVGSLDPKSQGVESTPLAAPAPDGRPGRPSRRARRAAIALTVLGASAFASALAIEGLAYQRADELASILPSEQGYLSQSADYTRVRRTVGPVAFAGAALMSVGLLWQQRSGSASDRPRRRVTAALAGALGLALIGAGAALWVMKPARVGEGELPAPRRELGMLLVGAGLPALTWTFGEVTR